MRKKILTSLLVGVTLNGVTIPVVFAENNLSQKNTKDLNIENVNFLNNKLNIKINYNTLNNPGYKKYDRIMDGHSQPFYREGFQAFYDPENKKMDYGYVFDIEEKTFKVKTGFFSVGSNLYHSNSHGHSSIGLKNIDGKLYYFDEYKLNPHAVRGWKDVGNQKYYFDTAFTAKTNGIYEIVEGGYYYFNEKGELQVGERTIKGKKYSFTGLGGRALLGWHNIGSKRYYFNDMREGAAEEGWFTDSGGTAYFFTDNYRKGVMASGIVDIPNDGIYLFKATGNSQNAYKQYGFYSDQSTANKDRYYFNPNDKGRAHIGWYTYNGKKMYFNKDNGYNRGVMANGVTKIDGEYYLFLSSGNDWNAYQAYGWYNYGGKRYYFNPDSDGRAVRNDTIKIGREWCTFDKDGNLIKHE